MTSRRLSRPADRAPEPTGLAARSASELLYDSEAMLRKVDSMLAELRELDDRPRDMRMKLVLER